MPRLLAVLSILSALIAGATSASAQTAAEVAKAKDQIWAKEVALTASHARGSAAYYAPDFLGWTYGLPKPFRMSDVPHKTGAAPPPSQEKVESSFRDFTLHGDTAVVYFVNHRTMRADGTPADDNFDVLHVWVRDGNDWKIVASMSRASAAPK